MINNPPHRLPDGEHPDHAGPGHRPRRLRPQLLLQGNHLFRTWTSADAIIDYLVFAKNYIAQCEERHGSTPSSAWWTPATP